MIALRAALTLLCEAAIVVLFLWSIGAAAGVVMVGFCMVAGCRG